MSDIEEIYKNTLLTLLSFGDNIELRLILANGKIEAFQGELTEENLEKFVGIIQRLDKKCQIEMMLNPLLPATIANKKHAGNANIAYRRYVQIDVDSISDGMVTDEVKAMCYEVILQIREYLTEMGFCMPLLTDSGNAFHLIYHVGNVPNDTATANIIRAFLNGLKSRFANDHITVDTATHHAARLLKVYGTHSTKPPYRQSRILEIPDDWRVSTVTLEQLQTIVSENPTEKMYSVDSFKKMKPRELIKWETELVLKLLYAQGITIQNIQSLDDGARKYILCGCPFAKPSSTRQTACLFVNKSGKISLSCLHSDCEDFDLQSFLLNQANQKI